MLAVALFLAPDLAAAHMPIDRPSARRATVSQLTVAVERRVLPNGLVVVLSPEPSASTIVVHHLLRAGAAFEPRGQHGLAHLTEHVMFRGPTPDTDYETVLRRRGAISTAAYTTRYAMRFDVQAPPSELPLSLWVVGDRMAELPRHLDAVDLAAHKRIVLAERNERTVDREYGLVDEVIDQTRFPAGHPLHGGIGGSPESIHPLTIADVRDFVERHLVPANSVVVVAGKFDVATAHDCVDRYLAGIPGGHRTPGPELPTPKGERTLVTAREVLSRQPRVSLTWLISNQRREILDVLDQGAILLSLTTDGAFGTRVMAGLDEYGPEGVFRMDVTLPYDKPQDSALAEAEALLRYLTITDMTHELIVATNLYRDRATLFDLDEMSARASLLGRLELAGLNVAASGEPLARHWVIDAATIQEVSRKLLRNARVEVYAAPVHPRQPRVQRGEEQ